MGWELFLLWFRIGKNIFWIGLPKKEFFFPKLFLGIGKQCIFSETHLLDWVMQWITKMEHFLGMMYFFWERNKCFWNGDL